MLASGDWSWTLGGEMSREADKWPVNRPEDASACGRSYEYARVGG